MEEVINGKTLTGTWKIGLCEFFNYLVSLLTAIERAME
jgi:hypothetical protein